MSDTQFVTLPGSDRAPRSDVERVGAVPDGDVVELTVLLRRRAALPADVLEGRRWMTRERLAADHGADERDAARVRELLDAAGFAVTRTDLGARSLAVRGTVGAVRGFFGTDPETVRDPRGATCRHRSGPLRIPAECSDLVTAVLGIDDRPQAHNPLRVYSGDGPGRSYTPPQLGTVYGFPEGTDGSGETVAIVELGGGYRQQDLDHYFGGLDLAVPAVRAVGVDGASNNPGSDENVDTEVTLDIEVAGALAPKAEFVVYFAPNTDKGFVDAVKKAAHADPTPTAISISWGQSEDAWSAQSREALDGALADAAALGVTVCAAAGDRGSSDGASDGEAHADFPASSPHVLGCGGTSLVADASGTVDSETVWSSGGSGGATGGGVSDAFDLPEWQQHAGVPQREGGGAGRGVPDVAADADPATGYQVLVGRERSVVGGTSAVAPLWAALVARLAQSLGSPLGLAQPRLYAGVRPDTVVDGFRDVTSGDNGAYRAGPGWDACTGLGVPEGSALLRHLSGSGS